MQKPWLIIGAVALATCFTAGIIVSRTGLSLPTLQPADAAIQTTSTASPQPASRSERRPPSEAKKQRPLRPHRLPPELELSLDDARLEDGRYVIYMEDGSEVYLTLEPDLQEHMSSLYERVEVPHAAAVVTEVKTGRVRALINHESAPEEERVGQVALEPIAPSASVFKLVTAAALIEDNGITPKTRTCYHGGRASLSRSEIIGDPRRDHRCTDFATAFGRSTNAVFAKLAYEHLTSDELATWAARFGYNEPIPFHKMPLKPSRAEIPEDPIERARVAAGFWHTHLSPMHAALMSATVGNGGVMMRPSLIEKIIAPDGEVVYKFQPTPYKRVMEERTARELGDLMVRTTTIGTGRRYFQKLLPKLAEDYTIGGKTGTLARKDPSYLLYTWFIGLAPIEDPELAISTLVCNPMRWRLKGVQAAANLFRAEAPEKEEPAPPVDEQAEAAQD